MTETKPQPKTVKTAKAQPRKGVVRPQTKPQSRGGSARATGRSAGAATLPAASKLDRLTALLAQPEGASLAEMMALTDWQAHSVRGVLAGALKRRGLTIASEKIDGVRRYRSGAAR